MLIEYGEGNFPRPLQCGGRAHSLANISRILNDDDARRQRIPLKSWSHQGRLSTLAASYITPKVPSSDMERKYSDDRGPDIAEK
jgi:hypothetical protein